MQTLGISLTMAQRATASGTRIFQILDRHPLLRSPADAQDAAGGVAGRSASSTSRFATTARGPTRCATSTWTIPAGRTVALVGTTGSGKTTLAMLVPRLYEASRRAQVLIDGTDVREVELSSLRRAIALTGDDPFLFSTSVHANIAYARPQASRAEVQEAARRAQADEFIRRLPEGYDTRIGERGLTVSGGQRQRLAIARAILADPRILILDDATSSVDASTEHALKLGLAEVMAGRHDDHHRPPALDDRAGRRGHRARRRGARRLRDARGPAHELRAVPPDRRADRGRAASGGRAADGGQAMSDGSRTSELRRRLRGTRGRTRRLRGLASLLGPYRRRAALMIFLRSSPVPPPRSRRRRSSPTRSTTASPSTT